MIVIDGTDVQAGADAALADTWVQDRIAENHALGLIALVATRDVYRALGTELRADLNYGVVYVPNVEEYATQLDDESARLLRAPWQADIVRVIYWHARTPTRDAICFRYWQEGKSPAAKN